MSQTKSILDESYAIAWLGKFVQHGGPRYLQIADFIERALASGTLRNGDRLPPQRRLAALLGVDLTTVTRAYDEAKRRNLLIGKGARGTYASAPKVELGQILDLSMNMPPPPAGIDFAELLKLGISQIHRNCDSDMLMNYHLGGGSPDDCAAGATWLQPMLGAVNPATVTVCPGAQAALAALILVLTRVGDVILTEPAIYPGLRSAAQSLGRRVVCVDVDRDGMMPSSLMQALRRYRAPMVYLNPTLQNPTGHTMPVTRRAAIAAMLESSGTYLVEDDPYWQLLPLAPPPLATMATQRVCYVATLSKCLVPGLRTAYVWIHDGFLRARFLDALRSFSLMTPPFTSALASQWIRDGSAERLLKAVREEANLRQRMASNVLAGREPIQQTGIHLWLELPSYWTPKELVIAASSEGLAVASPELFYDQADPPSFVRITLGAIRERQKLSVALLRLSQLLARRPMQQQSYI